MQANLIVLPSRYASSFRDLCLRNPVPCPLLEVLPPGTFSSKLAHESDIRTDIPAYNIFHNGVLVTEAKGDVREEWTNDHVGFLIGCSYSFETALAASGLPPRNMREHLAVPMYTSNIPLMPAGLFHGKVVVSMRSFKEEEVERVREITRPYRRQHGEPIAWGWDGAERLGLLDKVRKGEVDFGEAIEVPEGEVPVFWACGVTPQVAVMESKLEGVVLSHHPGSMFVTDLRSDAEDMLEAIV